MKYIYHYHLTYQEHALGKETSIDGLIELTNKPSTMDQYRKIKKLIEPVHHEIATLCTLNPIGEIHE
jgi:hypothetical protein